jgi:hypothetical protein
VLSKGGVTVIFADVVGFGRTHTTLREVEAAGRAIGFQTGDQFACKFNFEIPSNREPCSRSS